MEQTNSRHYRAAYCKYRPGNPHFIGAIRRRARHKEKDHAGMIFPAAYNYLLKRYKKLMQ
ncbi:hypothetical protein DPQ22_08915 [Candidatus Tokpelaia sp.]|nr:hypothetical protein DPQ22_08915 [Candidatus Tokpelaia sp.]